MLHLAARHVPGTGPPDIQRLGSGLVNETYRVLRDGKAYALRVVAANPYDLGVDREWEVRVLRQAAAAQLAPVVEYFDPRGGILITRWEDGRSWSPAQVRLPTNISRMAELARRIHALPLPTPARRMSPATWIDYYGVGAGEGAAAAFRQAAALQLSALGQVPTAIPVLCHSDLHSLNVIDRGASMILLDWEYAHASDPLWDLASWSASNDLEESLQHTLLKAYLGRMPNGSEYLRLRLLGWLYDYVCLLWSELYLNLARDRRPGHAPQAIDTDQSIDELGAVRGRVQLLSERLTHQSGRAC